MSRDEMKTVLNADIAAALKPFGRRPPSHVFLVACGGSLSSMHAGKYYLDRSSPRLACDLLNADEFVCRDPRKLGPDALVILCSQTGTTPETLRAADLARSRSARTIGMTLDLGSPLAKGVDATVAYRAPYTTGAPIDAADSNYGVLLMLLAELVRLVDGEDRVPALLASLSALQPAIDRAHSHFAPVFAEFAPRLASKNVIYTMASGPCCGAAYSFAICVLMEMLWIGSQAIHADEFFHGPFEVVDRDAAFIQLVGLGETRRLDERARAFLERFGASENLLVLDARDLDLSGIDEGFQPYLTPLIFFDVLWKFAYRLAALREHVMLDGRRYMKKLTGY
jgi:fructoselysine 6-phosphate deglycase